MTALIRSLVLLAAVSLAGSAPALAHSTVHGASRSPSLAPFFPTAAQWPKGVRELAVQQYANPAQLFTNKNVSLARRDHLVVGAVQAAIGRRNVVATIVIARFRTATDARHFGSSVQSDVTPGGAERSGPIHNLGAGGGRYVRGNCASCGPTAPPLYQVFFARGTLVVDITTQPADRALTQHLALVIDTKLKHQDTQ